MHDVPTGAAAYRVLSNGAAAAWCRGAVEPAPDGSAVLHGTLTLFDDRGIAIAEVQGLEFRRISRAASRPRSSAQLDASVMRLASATKRVRARHARRIGP